VFGRRNFMYIIGLFQPSFAQAAQCDEMKS